MSVSTLIGWRYLKAKRKQAFISFFSLISLAGVALGVTALIVVLAVMSGTEEEVRKRILGVNSHIVVLKFGNPMDNYGDLLPNIMDVEGVATVNPFIYNQVLISAKGGISGAILRGAAPGQLNGPAGLERNLMSGSLESLADPGEAPPPDYRPGILLGKELATQLGVGLGDIVRIMAPAGRVTPLGGRAPSVRLFRVGGLMDAGMYEYNVTLAYISLSQAQDFLSLGRGVTGLEITVNDIYKAAEIKSNILKALGGSYWARDWMQMNRNLFSALAIQKYAMFIILSLTILVAAFNIVSTLIMVVMEKARDIAILKSMGATRWTITKIFIFQGSIIGGLGTALGFAAATILCEILKRRQIIDLPADVYYITTLPAKMEIFDVSVIIFSSLFVSLLATVYPAWQASRLNPVETLRYE